MRRSIPDFWNGRRVVVTGHTGFKGAWLALWLDRLGAQVTGFALPPDTERGLFGLCLERRIPTVIGDVTDIDALGRAVATAAPEIVFHLAADRPVLYARSVRAIAMDREGGSRKVRSRRARIPAPRRGVVPGCRRAHLAWHLPHSFDRTDHDSPAQAVSFNLAVHAGVAPRGARQQE
jgi:CDP-glucose 4,6-dehydratase